MKLIRSRRLLAGICAATAVAPAGALAGPPAPDVPTDIAVTGAHKQFLVGHAVGDQIYTCTAVPGGYAWSAATPRADLYDDRGNVIIRHYGGPSWQAKDGSAVVGRRDSGVSVDPTAIPWLKLSAASTSAGSDGARLAGTTFIQRIATTGGLVPAAYECNALTAGGKAYVPYTADYVFWKARET
jgi:hypothetical protein